MNRDVDVRKRFFPGFLSHFGGARRHDKNASLIQTQRNREVIMSKILISTGPYSEFIRHWLSALGVVALILIMTGCTDQSGLTGSEPAEGDPGVAPFFVEPNLPLPNPQHFLVHRIVPPPPEQDTIGVKGQFERNQPARRALVRRMRHLLNPAGKIHDGQTFPIVDDDEHLTAYGLLAGSEPMREVRLENQFGEQTWLIGDPLFLYTPAQKEGHAFPDSLDHYKCYRVLDSGGAVDVTVEVKDQFVPSATTIVREGKLFCVPVMKRHEDELYPIHRPVSHLAVYSIDPIPFDPLDKEVGDQFERERLITILGPIRLVAESRKLAWREVDTPEGAR